MPAAITWSATSQQGIGHRPGPERLPRDERLRVIAQPGRSPQKVDGAVDVVKRDDLTRVIAPVAMAGIGIDHLLPDVELVVLWFESVPPDHAPLAHLDVADEFETCDPIA